MHWHGSKLRRLLLSPPLNEPFLQDLISPALLCRFRSLYTSLRLLTLVLKWELHYE